MRTGVRFVAVALVGILLSGVMPPVASAQQPAQQPVQQPGQPVAQQPAQQPGMMQEQMKSRDDDNWDTVANVYNVAYVPGKVVLCALGGAAAAVLMIVTFGTAYKGANGVVREGCGGPWALSADDVRPTAQEDFYTRNPADR